MSSGGCCGHSHDVKPISETNSGCGLYKNIVFENVECLNETVENSGKKVFKSWEARLDKNDFVTSDGDEELLFNIPFDSNIKLKGIVIVGGEDGTCPNKMLLYKDRPKMSFDDTGAKCDQEFSVVYDEKGVIEYTTKPVAFSSITHLSIYFPSNIGQGDETKIYYIGLKGEIMPSQRIGVVNTVYEARPMMKDHKNFLDSGEFQHNIS